MHHKTPINPDTLDPARRLVREVDLGAIDGMGTTLRDKLIKAGEYPAALPLGERTKAWVLEEVYEWVAKRIAARDNAALNKSRKEQSSAATKANPQQKRGPGRPRKAKPPEFGDISAAPDSAGK
jgi:predicted DNA-binding transcriptional regulator AlpA